MTHVLTHLSDAPSGQPLRARLKDWSKQAAGWISAGLSTVLGPRAESQVGILVYHRISPRVAGLPEPSMNVTPRRFGQQIEGLLRRGYRIWPLQRVLDCHRDQVPVPPRTVVITFDDGFASVHRHAWPVLARLGASATVFLSTAFLDQDDPFPFDAWGQAHRNAPPGAYRPLSTEECQQMLTSGVMELGAHTHTHQDFRQRRDAFVEDLAQSVVELRERFGITDPTFAFPFGRRALGYVTEDLMESARAVGTTCGLTTEAELVDSRTTPFGWGRFNAYDWDTPATLIARLQGWYGWAPRLQEWLSGKTP